jgi:outer membrane receptor protein involved in Fe transport
MRILLSLFLLPLCASAENDIARVEVKAAGALQQRREDTAGRLVVSRDEILRYGDATVADTLRRQPGVTVNGGQVQLRGLGGGRTQFLLNGQPAPPGFSPDSLAPELIERIEILRSASADSSTEGIAGSINIVLRRSVGRARTLATVAGARSGAGWSPEAALDLSRPGEELSGTLSAQASRARGATGNRIFERTPTADRFTQEDFHPASERLALAPRLNWKSDGGEKLAWQGLLEHDIRRNRSQAQETTLRGDASDFPRNGFGVEYRTVIARSDIDGSHRLGDDARLEWKAGLAHSQRKGDYLFTGSSVDGDPLWRRHVLSSAKDDGASSSGKLRFGGGGGHALAAGWDASLSQRGEWRRQEDADAAGGVLDQRYVARVRRLAMFTQDEWSVSPALDAYLGLRWEGLLTRTDGRDLPAVSSSSGVWSPVAHVLWRIPGSSDQLRLALARSYKAPETRDLVPRRYTVNNGNSPANPDFQGNPGLRPELAWGLDGAYEHYFSKESMFSAAVYRRRIANVIQPVLFEDKGKWVATPSNVGDATVSGIELDGRLALGAGSLAHLGFTRNWSHVDSVPGPGNRLDEQVPLTVNAGMEFRLGATVAAGFNWNLKKGGVTRLSALRWSERGAETRLDLHASWQLRPGLGWRASASNALRPDTQSRQRFEDGSHDTLRQLNASGERTVRLALEFAL